MRLLDRQVLNGVLAYVTGEGTALLVIVLSVPSEKASDQKLILPFELLFSGPRDPDTSRLATLCFMLHFCC